MQSQKAGLLEVGDCLVLNKADHPGADAAERDLLELLHLRGASSDGWEARLFKTVAARGEGVPALLDAIEAHGRHLRATGDFARHAAGRFRRALLEQLRERVEVRILLGAERDPELRRLLADVESGGLDPYTAADRWIETLWPASRAQ